MQIGLQPHTLHETDESTPSVVERAGRAGYEGVELGIDADTDAVHDALDAADLAVSSVSVPQEDLEAGDLDAVRAAADALGTDHAVLMWLGEEHWATRGDAEETAALLDEYADRCGEAGLTLHYHNHAHEFTDLDGTTGYEAAVEASSAIRFELDLGWAGTGGADPAALFDRMADRVSLVHVKDMDFERGEFVTVGEGDLDLEAAVGAARDADVEWAIFENDQPVDPRAEIGHASVLLNRHVGHLCR